VNVVPGSFKKCVGIKLGWEQGYRLTEMPPRRLKTPSGNPTLDTKPKGENYIIMRDINKIVIHCSATREGQDFNVETIRKWHTDPKPQGRGWSDIGYHYLIRLNGDLEIGRSIDRQGAHTRGHNKDSIGICYVGGVEKDGKTPKDTMTSEQEKSMREIIFALRIVQDKNITIHGHNEFSAKACPSFTVSEKFADIM
tara:strand:+ start:4639 stop:5226 length:588 start_codon:yes stop_codon:yes gene_type:complete